MLRLGHGVWAGTLVQLRDCGRGRNECVIYWTGPLDNDDMVDRAVHPEHTSAPGHYAPTQEWLQRFWVSLHREKRTVRGQVHTHGGPAFHSRTDDEYPLVHTTGFVSLVVPDFACSASRTSAMYLVEMGVNGEWRPVAVGDRITGIA
jgi:hypothetical protein